MQLYLVQHGEAKPEAEDTNRSLTEKGRAEANRVAAAVDNLRIKPTKIFHSGKLRAQQTAELFAEVLIPVRGAEASSGLAPNDPIQQWVDRLGQEEHDLMLVGHLPHLDRLASKLLCGDEQVGVIRFRNAAVVCLAREGSHWAVQWISMPEMS